MVRVFFLTVLIGGCSANQIFEAKNSEAAVAPVQPEPESEDAVKSPAGGEIGGNDPELVPVVNTDDDEKDDDEDPPVVTTPVEDNVGDSSGGQAATELAAGELSEMEEFIEGWCPFRTDYFVGKGDPKGKERVTKDDYAWLEKVPGGDEYEKVVTFAFGNTRSNPTCMADIIVDFLTIANLKRLIGTDKEIECDPWATYDKHNDRLERRFAIKDMTTDYGRAGWSTSCHSTVGILFKGKSDGSMEILVLEHTDRLEYEAATRFYNSDGKRFKKTQVDL